MSSKKKWIIFPALFALVFLATVFTVDRGVTPVIIKPTPNSPFPIQFNDTYLFSDAISRASTTPLAIGTVTGIIVPHHLLANQLIADAFAAVAGQKFNLVVVISPDHYSLGTTSITVADRDFETVFGKIGCAREEVKKLLAVPGIGRGDFFYREHGIGAELPFIKYYFPEAKIMAVTIRNDTAHAELDNLISALKKILPTSTLVVQSTDFSHYLTEKIANLKDKETIAAMQTEDAGAVLRLSQPDHIDSRDTLYVQMRLQQELFHSHLRILEQRNSQYYTSEKVEQTTSYVTAVFEK